MAIIYPSFSPLSTPFKKYFQWLPKAGAAIAGAQRSNRLFQKNIRRSQSAPDLIQSHIIALPCQSRYPLSQRFTLAPLPFITFSTSFSDAMVVSPGVVIASAPCAAP